MDRQQILLAKSLEAARIPLSVATFDDRLILQKSVYLLQSAGIQLGYRFRWYLKGPYSPDMTANAFGIVNEGESGAAELMGWKLDETSAQIGQRLHPLLCREGESASDQARRLELLASVLFLFKTRQAQAADPVGTAAILKKNGKNFSADDVTGAVAEMRDYALLS